MPLIYLVRHASPKLPDERSYCIGRGTDVPLSERGIAQSNALLTCFKGTSLGGIFASPLARSRQTAEIIAAGREIVFLADIDEIDVGEWEGKPFDEIRKDYADIYAARGLDWSIAPPGGETLERAAERMKKAILRAARGWPGDLLFVTHDGAIRGLLYQLLRVDTKRYAMLRQPYASITVLRLDGDNLSVTAAGKLPEDTPSDEEIEELWTKYKTPVAVRDHCEAVCESVLEMRESLLEHGVFLSQEYLRAAALLHDIHRHEGRVHARRTGAILRERGYIRTAHIVATHHDSDFGEQIDEEQVLFLADKFFDGAKKLTIEERFAKSSKKCHSQEAVRNHGHMFEAAIRIKEKIDRILNSGLVK